MSRVAIAVCTYRRESVLETLQSLMEITLPKGVETDIMVIDNDVTPSARDRVETFAETAPRAPADTGARSDNKIAIAKGPLHFRSRTRVILLKVSAKAKSLCDRARY